MINFDCDCIECVESESPCKSDCMSDDMCYGCREELEANKDREHDEACALGYKQGD